MNHSKQFGENDYQIIKKEILYEGTYRLVRYHIKHRLFNGEWSPVITRELLERDSAVAVLPYDPILDRVILIEQFRPAAIPAGGNPWMIEIVAGCISPGETLEEVAIRESEEEAGCQIQSLHFISEYYVSPGCLNEYITIYLGKIDASNVKGIHGLPDETEDIRVLNLSSAEAFQLVEEGKVNTAPAVVALQWLMRTGTRPAPTFL
jgi:ADP-ribose pyrophosphatase